MKYLINEVVQLNPEKTKNRMFAGCFFVITEPKEWGAQGYVQALGENNEIGGQAYYRATHDEIERFCVTAPFCVK